MKIRQTIQAACVAAIASIISSEVVFAQPYDPPQALRATASRTAHSEAYFGVRTVFGETVNFPGGSSIETDDDLGFAIGFGHHFNEHLLLSGEFAWSTIDYDGTIVSADLPALPSQRISGELETGSMSASATWHFLPSALTPYASATLGWTWIDTNIATGPPQAACWWDPWWGYICTPVQETLREDGINYGLGLGIRWAMSPAAFLRLGYEHRWLDIANALGTPAFGGLRLEIGTMF